MLTATKFGVEFKLMNQVNVNGKNTHDLYNFLRSKSSLFDARKQVAKEIPWNFTKFLVNGDGKCVKFYHPRINPS